METFGENEEKPCTDYIWRIKSTDFAKKKLMNRPLDDCGVNIFFSKS